MLLGTAVALCTYHLLVVRPLQQQLQRADAAVEQIAAMQHRIDGMAAATARMIAAVDRNTEAANATIRPMQERIESMGAATDELRSVVNYNATVANYNSHRR